MEEKQQHDRQELELALRSGHTATWMCDLKSEAFEWHVPLERFFNIPVSYQDKPVTYQELIHPEDQKRVQSKLDAIFMGQGDTLTDTHRVLLPGGRERWMQMQAEVKGDLDHPRLHLMGTIHDITERKTDGTAGRGGPGTLSCFGGTGSCHYLRSHDRCRGAGGDQLHQSAGSKAIGLYSGRMAGRWSTVVQNHASGRSGSHYQGDRNKKIKVGKIAITQEYRVRTKDGRWIWLHNESVTLRNTRQASLYQWADV